MITNNIQDKQTEAKFCCGSCAEFSNDMQCFIFFKQPQVKFEEMSTAKWSSAKQSFIFSEPSCAKKEQFSKVWFSTDMQCFIFTKSGAVDWSTEQWGFALHSEAMFNSYSMQPIEKQCRLLKSMAQLSGVLLSNERLLW